MDRLIIRIHRKDKQSGVYPIIAYSGTGDSKGIPNAASFRNPLRTRELGELQEYVEKWRRTPEEMRSIAVYIGMIGSARKIGLMREKFLQEGWATSEQFNRIHAPIGIDIQSKTVQEIAVSIAAQLILVRRQNQAFGKRLSKKD